MWGNCPNDDIVENGYSLDRNRMGLGNEDETNSKEILWYDAWVRSEQTGQTLSISLFPMPSLVDANKQYSKMYKFCQKIADRDINFTKNHFRPCKIVLEINGKLWYGAVGFSAQEKEL